MLQQAVYFGMFLAVFLGLILFLHYLRTVSYRGPFVMAVVFLWLLIYLTGQLGYKLEFAVTDGFSISVRYSSALYTLIFAGILLVYITEGVQESRNIILVSLGSQVLLGLSQVFLYLLALPLIAGKPELHAAAEIVFKPSFDRLLVSIVAVGIDLFFAVACFQWLVNRLKSPMFLILFLALSLTMALDSLIFVGGTRSGTFWPTLQSHLVFKTTISFVIAGPLALYVRWFGARLGLDLERGSLDIFRKLERLEEDLEAAHKELRRYADHLEQMVDERTEEIRRKQHQIDMELRMAAEVQVALLPPMDKFPLPHAVLYRPCSSVSGDLYEYGVLSSSEAYVFLADISGHGVPSALVGIMCFMALSRVDALETRPDNVLTEISRELTVISGTHYLTGVFLRIHHKERVVAYANGGHPAPILLGPSGDIFELEATGSLVGVGAEVSYGLRRVRYSPGTRLVLFTDCAYEARDAGKEELGRPRFVQLLQDTRALEPEEVTKRVLALVTQHVGRESLDDDLSLIIVDLP